MKYRMNRWPTWSIVAIVLAIAAFGLAGCLSSATSSLQNTVEPALTSVPATATTAAVASATASTSPALPTQTAAPMSRSRGYLTTPAELRAIASKAEQGVEPYRGAVDDVMKWADKDWKYKLDANVACKDKQADMPAWIDNGGGIPILYAKALAFHLSGDPRYAEQVKNILQDLMTRVKTISIEDQQCRINFSWGTPELVASADLIEDYWHGMTCTGPLQTVYDDTSIGSGDCKTLFQNWLVKNPYYVVSYSMQAARSNWGASATTTTAYIADYLWDRPEVKLIHRNPPQVEEGKDVGLSPSQAYAHANTIAISSMNGYEVEYGSSNSCDLLNGPQQGGGTVPIKSQITENGIISEDARREEFCNITKYNGEYQNYPQLHIGDTVQQCELMLRRGDSSCYDNVDMTDKPNYTFVDPEGTTRTTHLYPGRGSLERAIKAVIVDSKTDWRHVSALEVAYRYYYNHHRLPGIEEWFEYIESQRSDDCSQDICFGTLTHGFAVDEQPTLPPTVPQP